MASQTLLRLPIVVSIYQEVVPPSWLLSTCHQHKYVVASGSRGEISNELLGPHLNGGALAHYSNHLPPNFDQQELAKSTYFQLWILSTTFRGKAGNPSPRDTCWSALLSYFSVFSTLIRSACFVWLTPDVCSASHSAGHCSCREYKHNCITALVC